MSDTGMPWVKLFTEIIDDSKVGKLTDVVKWRYVSLIALAGECDAEGFLVNGNDAMSIQDIAWRLRVPASKLEQEFEKISEQGLIDTVDDVWRVTKFSERQGRSQSDRREQWKARKAKQRQKTEGLEWSSLENPVDVTPNVTRDSSVTPASVTLLEKEGEKSKRKNSAEAPPDSLFFIAKSIAKVCQMDLDANKARIFREAKLLIKASPAPTPELIEQHYNGNPAAFWMSHDWRGKRGSLPTPPAIRETWGQWARVPAPKPSEKVVTAADIPGIEVSPEEHAKAYALLQKRLGKK